MLVNGMADIDGRLDRVEGVLRTTFNAMPKNGQGKLDHAAVRYTLHGYFVQRHGWYVRGLSDVGESFNGTSASEVLQDRVEDFIQVVFEQRVGAHGLDLREMAMLAATFENLVRQESQQRLNATLDVLNISSQRDLTVAQVDEVLDTYMMSYLLRFELNPRALQYVQERINKLYPAWTETQQFLRQVREQWGHRRSFFERSDVEGIVEQVGDQYGRWQDKECLDLKHQMMAIEDQSIGTNGSGRVRLSDFYGSAVNAGNWQFRETKEYLAQLGALDASDPNIPRVIIPNYMNSPSNCLAGSKYYSVCCINECEELIDHLEHHFQMPTVAPAQILEVVSSLPSSSVPAGHTLRPILVDRLHEIAKHHGGRVPMHGRMFSQWMHHAYPRECPYPHLAGTIQPQRTREYNAEKGVAPSILSEDLAGVMELVKAEEASSDMDSSEDCTMWSHHEELYVNGSADEARSPKPVRMIAYLSIAVAAVFMLGRRVVSSGKMVFAAAGGAGGKDIFV